MKRILILLLLTQCVYAGKVYESRDANGNRVYSDIPPQGKPPDSKDVKANSIQTRGGGYTLTQATRNNPVVLWANNCGKACDDARELLRRRGVPYSSRNPQVTQGELDALKKLVGDAVVPVLQVGTTTQKGFEEGAWQAALDQAGYPKTADPTLKPLPVGSAPSPKAN